MKRALKILAFLVLFTATAVGTTYVLIQYELTKQQPLPEPAPAEQGIDLDGFYDENDLLFEEILEENGDVRITYPRIDGLKDEAVEAAINEMIAAKAEEIKAYHEEGGGISYMTYQVYANFANALSIGLFSADTEYSDRQDYLNFNLTDGSLIRLEDLFCAGADIQSPVRAAFYETLTRYNLSPDYWEEVSSPDENELYRVVRGYLAGEQRFSFSPSEIYLHYEDYTASVPMMDYAEDIAVYHRFLSDESLFERDDIGYKNVFTCAELSDGYVRREYGFGAENFWYDVASEEVYRDADVDEDVYEQLEALAGGIYDGILHEVLTIAETAKANPDRAYVLLAAPTVYLYSDSAYVDGSWQLLPSKAATVNAYYVLYEMDRTLFDDEYRDVLVTTYRENPWYLFYMEPGDEAVRETMTITRRNKDSLCLYATGEVLTVEDVFVSGYDYAAAIRAQAKYDLMAYYGCTPEEAEAKARTVSYTLAGNGIEIRLPDWGEDQYLWMALNDFNRDNLTIFQ